MLTNHHTMVGHKMRRNVMQWRLRLAWWLSAHTQCDTSMSTTAKEHDGGQVSRGVTSSGDPTWVSEGNAGDWAEIDALSIGCPMQLGLKRARVTGIATAHMLWDQHMRSHTHRLYTCLKERNQEIKTKVKQRKEFWKTSRSPEHKTPLRYRR